MRAAENDAVGSAAETGQEFADVSVNERAQLVRRRARLDRTGKVRASLLHDSHAGRAFADFERITPGLDGAVGREDGDGSKLLLVIRSGTAVRPSESGCRFD